MILAVDFDLTICSDSSFGKPMDGAAQKLKWLKTRGHELVVHTCKANTPAGRDAIESWLLRNGIRANRVAGKIQADVYLDDKALHFEDWEQVWNALR